MMKVISRMNVRSIKGVRLISLICLQGCTRFLARHVASARTLALLKILMLDVGHEFLSEVIHLHAESPNLIAQTL